MIVRAWRHAETEDELPGIHLRKQLSPKLRTSQNEDGAFYGVFAQRYSASVVPQGSEFRVNSYTTGYDAYPSVAMDSAGDFVIAWQAYNPDGSGYGVYAQRYNSSGVTQGTEFRVNSYTTNKQLFASAAMDSAARPEP